MSPDNFQDMIPKSSELASGLTLPDRKSVSWSALVKNEWVLSAFLILISATPTLALWRHSAYLTGDSYQYLRAALTFANGQGFQDMSGNPFTFLTPLYPLVIGIAHRLTPSANIETTARLVSLVGATTAVIALYWLLRARHSLWVSFSAALLFAILPLRVWSGLWALSEGLYLGLLMLGLAVLFRPARRFWLSSVLGGILLGLAYLTRPEAMVALAASAILFFFKTPHGKKRTLAIVAGFLLIALPYHARVYQVTGTLSSGRLSLLFVQSESFRRGQGPEFVHSHEVDQQTISIQQHTPDMSLGAVIARYAFFARWEVERLVYGLGPHWIVLGLLVLGCIILLTTNVRLVRGIAFEDMWQFVLPLMIPILPFLHIEDRYLLQAMPVFLLWLVLIVASIHRLVATKFLYRPKRLAGLVPIALVGVFILSYGYRLATQIPSRDTSVLARNTARWCESQGLSPAPIISQTPDLAFFGNVSHLWMPSGAPADVLKYAQRSGAHYVYVSSQDVPTPLNDLLLGNNAQIPDSLKLLHEESDGPMRGRLFELKS